MNPQDISPNLIIVSLVFYALSLLAALFLVNKFFGERRYRSAASRTTLYSQAKRPKLDALLTLLSFVPGLNTLGVVIGLLIWFVFQEYID